jgi:LacI family transcriptional regulator
MRWPENKKKLKVALLVESSRAYTRELLKGIAKYVRIHSSWSVEFQEGISAENIPKWFAGRKWNGIITEINNAILAETIKKSAIPVVDLYGDLPNSEFPVVRSDDILIGRIAAEHLIDRGFRRFAFCGISGHRWSDLRLKGFESRVAEAGFPLRIFEKYPTAEVTPGLENEEHGKGFDQKLKTWLRALPKPSGLMACNDARGWQVLACCQDLNLNVPDDLAVIGVDNHEIYCEFSKVALSSVIIDARRIGYEAAELLSRLMANPNRLERVLLIKPTGVAERRSTDALAIADPHLVKATRLIREHACDGLDVPELLQSVRMSRRVLEREFLKVLGRTPKAEILRIRLKRVSELLVESNMKLSSVASEAGFQNTEHMCRMFKKKFGVTPGEFRNKAQLF